MVKIKKEIIIIGVFFLISSPLVTAKSGDFIPIEFKEFQGNASLEPEPAKSPVGFVTNETLTQFVATEKNVSADAVGVFRVTEDCGMAIYEVYFPLRSSSVEDQPYPQYEPYEISEMSGCMLLGPNRLQIMRSDSLFNTCCVGNDYLGIMHVGIDNHSIREVYRYLSPSESELKGMVDWIMEEMAGHDLPCDTYSLRGYVSSAKLRDDCNYHPVRYRAILRCYDMRGDVSEHTIILANLTIPNGTVEIEQVKNVTVRNLHTPDDAVNFLMNDKKFLQYFKSESDPLRFSGFFDVKDSEPYWFLRFSCFEYSVFDNGSIRYYDGCNQLLTASGAIQQCEPFEFVVYYVIPTGSVDINTTIIALFIVLFLIALVLVMRKGHLQEKSGYMREGPMRKKKNK